MIYNRDEKYPENEMYPVTGLRVGNVITDTHGSYWIVHEIYLIFEPSAFVRIALLEAKERRHLRFYTVREFIEKAWFVVPNYKENTAC